MNINTTIYHKINSLSGKNKWLDAFGMAGGEWALFGMIGWFVVSAWMKFDGGLAAKISASVVLLVAGLSGWALNWIIAFIVREPRPFLSGDKDSSMIHPMFPALFKWKSFPSDHAMFAFTIFFTALILHLPLAWPLLVLAIWTGWGRVFVGVHYPGDIVGGFAVAMFVASVANYLINVVRIFNF